MRILRRGDTGADVRTAQTALIRAGYDPGRVDGVFGIRTENAVKQFQRVLGATEDGIIGPVTWRYLEPFANEPDAGILRRGSRGQLVRIVQDALKTAGLAVGTIDGLFGTRTQAAVTAFQRSVGLPQTGVVDADTWLALAPYIDYTGIYVRPTSQGIFVAIVQQALINAGYTDLQVTGIYDAKTGAAIRSFQTANGLAADGIVGPRTWAALDPYIKGSITPEPQYILYTVQPGDTLSSIAAKYNTTVAQLLALNPRRDPDLIFPGEVLKVPVVKP